MQTRASLYVGSNNTTGELETAKAREIAGRYFQSFSTVEMIGHWEGSQERTLKIEILTDGVEQALFELADELREELSQVAVLLELVVVRTVLIKEQQPVITIRERVNA